MTIHPQVLSNREKVLAIIGSLVLIAVVAFNYTSFSNHAKDAQANVLFAQDKQVVEELNYVHEAEEYSKKLHAIPAMSKSVLLKQYDECIGDLRAEVEDSTFWEHERTCTQLKNKLKKSAAKYEK